MGNAIGVLREKLHELCANLVPLSELCRSPPECVGGGTGNAMNLSRIGNATIWAHVGNTLDVLRDMVHENGTLEWDELVMRVGGNPPPLLPAPYRRPAAADTMVAQQHVSGKRSNESLNAIMSDVVGIPSFPGNCPLLLRELSHSGANVLDMPARA